MKRDEKEGDGKRRKQKKKVLEAQWRPKLSVQDSVRRNRTALLSGHLRGKRMKEGLRSHVCEGRKPFFKEKSVYKLILEGLNFEPYGSLPEGFRAKGRGREQQPNLTDVLFST